MKCNDRTKDIPSEHLEMAEICSKYGYEIYDAAKKRFSEDSDEAFNMIMNSLG